jgi:type IV pilus assembly protein PilW
MMMQTRRDRGFSLIELMIAMVLGLMLSAGIFTVFSGNKQSSDLNTTMADMQESARFAMNQLSSDIRMAGYQGCKDINRGGGNILAVGAPTANLETTAVIGSVVASAEDWQPNPPIALTSLKNVVPDTHALTLQFGSPATFPLVEAVGGDVPDRSDPILVNTSEGISSEPFNMKAGEFAIISNCTGSDLIKLTSVAADGTVEHANGENTSNSLSYDYNADKNTKFMRFNSNIYFIGDTGSTSSDGNMIKGLYQQRLPYENNNPPILMISGVENMRILFGMRRGTSGLSFLQPDSADLKTQDIESIRVGLLMVSNEAVTDRLDKRTYTLAGQPILAGDGSLGTHPTDRRYRQAFNTTVKVRNRRDLNN